MLVNSNFIFKDENGKPLQWTDAVSSAKEFYKRINNQIQKANAPAGTVIDLASVEVIVNNALLKDNSEDVTFGGVVLAILDKFDSGDPAQWSVVKKIKNSLKSKNNFKLDSEMISLLKKQLANIKANGLPRDIKQDLMVALHENSDVFSLKKSYKENPSVTVSESMEEELTG